MPDRKIAFLVAAEGIERVELTEPWKAVSEAGYQPVLLSPETGEVQTFNHLTAAETAPVDQAVGDASVDDFDALVLPGGVANPDALRTDADISVSDDGMVGTVSIGSKDGLAVEEGRRRIMLILEPPTADGRILAAGADPRRVGYAIGR